MSTSIASDLRSRIVHLHSLEMGNETIAAFVELSPDEVARIIFDDWMEQRREQVRLAAMSKPEPAPTPRQLAREQRLREREQRQAERAAKQAAKQAAFEAARDAAEARRKIVHDGVGCPTEEQIAVACEAIRAGWTAHERVMRWLRAHSVDGIEGLAGDSYGVEISLVAVRDMAAAAA